MPKGGPGSAPTGNRHLRHHDPRLTPAVRVIIVTANMSCVGGPLSLRAKGRLAGRLCALLATVLLAAGINLGCEEAPASPGTSEHASAKTMHFRVDRARVGPVQRFDTFGLQFAPPAWWAPLPEDQLAAAAEALKGGAGAQPAATTMPAEEERFAAEPLAVFAQPERNLWLLVSAVEVPEPKVYAQALRQGMGARADEFILADGQVRVHQFLVQRDGLVNFKLLLTASGHAGARRLQLDYIVPQTEYEQAMGSLESSMGTIAPTSSPGSE